MAIKLIEGFSWTDGSNTGRAAFNTRYNSNAGNSYNITTGGGRFGGNCIATAGDAYVFNFPFAPIGPQIVIGMALKWAVTVGSVAQIFYPQDRATGYLTPFFEQISVRWTVNGNLSINRGATVLATGTRILQAATYYYIELATLIDSVAGTAKIYIDGVLDSQVAGVNTQAQATAVVASIAFGNANAPSACDMYVRDASVTPLGPRRVSTKLPTANGALQDWTPSAGNAFDRVKTVPPNSDANGYISDATPGDNSSFVFAALPYAPATVDAVQVSLYARFDDGGPHEIATFIRQGGNDFVGTTQAVAANYLDFYLQVYAQDPNTAAAWTAAGVDSAEYGVDLVS